jgi:glycosidase
VPERPTSSGLPSGWQHGAFMEVFVRAYQDSDGDGVGDLRGLASRLDYLQRLGVRGLWLMPITRSADHDHGYAVADFRAIEPAYGRWEDVDLLVREAHRRGIGIVVDYVINHASRENPLFVASASSRTSPWRDWFVWADEKPTGWDIFGKDPWTATADGAYFAQFGAPMPDFNLRERAVVDYHVDSLRLWLNHGIDGFRIDAVGHLFENGPKGWSLQPENYRFMRQLRDRLAAYPDRYWVCESPGDAIGFGRDDACGGSFAFGLSDALVKAARGDPKAIAFVADYWRKAPPGMATMVSNHDAFAGPRLWDAMKGDATRVRLAAATYLLQPGTPYLYYGEELGMSATGAEDGDWKLRGPMSWTADPGTAGFTTGTPYRAPSLNLATNNAAVEEADPGSLLNFYRALIGLRNAHPALAGGEYLSPRVDGRLMSFRRRQGTDDVVVVINYGDAPRWTAVPGLVPGQPLHRLLRSAPSDRGAASVVGADLKADASGTAHVRMPPRCVQVYMIR